MTDPSHVSRCPTWSYCLFLSSKPYDASTSLSGVIVSFVESLIKSDTTCASVSHVADEITLRSIFE